MCDPSCKYMKKVHTELSENQFLSVAIVKHSNNNSLLADRVANLFIFLFICYLEKQKYVQYL